MGAVGPANGWGFEAFGEWHWRGKRTSPSLRLAAALVFAGNVDLPSASAARVSQAGGVSANFAAGVSRLDGCPLGVALGERWTIAPCAGLELDLIRSAGHGPADPRTTITPRLTVVGTGRVTFLATSSLVVQLGAGALVPLDANTRYVFGGAGPEDQQTVIYTVPKVAAAGDLTVGWRLP
jgi:hypothetical protein